MVQAQSTPVLDPTTITASLINNPDGFKFMEHDSEHSLGANVEDMVNPLLTNDPRTFKR